MNIRRDRVDGIEHGTIIKIITNMEMNMKKEKEKDKDKEKKEEEEQESGKSTRVREYKCTTVRGKSEEGRGTR